MFDLSTLQPVTVALAFLFIAIVVGNTIINHRRDRATSMLRQFGTPLVLATLDQSNNEKLLALMARAKEIDRALEVAYDGEIQITPVDLIQDELDRRERDEEFEQIVSRG